MSTLTNIEKMKLEKLLGMAGGYVLDFSDRTFSEFVATATGENISDQKYLYNSGSKANRLRAFWNIESDQKVGKLLLELLNFWHAKKQLNEQTISKSEQDLFQDCRQIAERFSGVKSSVKSPVPSEEEFIHKEFSKINLSDLQLDSGITEILRQRLDEIKKCLNAKSALAVIFLCGSTLEGILLGVASQRSKDFNSSPTSPKDKNGQVKKIHEWTLANFIDVACALRFLGEDVKKFSHGLRDFRNYIHPFQQMATKFNPDEHTAKICWQVLQAAIAQLSIKVN